MKKAAVTSAVITILLLLSTMLCGLWLKAGNPGSVAFHMYSAMAAVVFSVVTLCLVIAAFSPKKEKKGKFLL